MLQRDAPLESVVAPAPVTVPVPVTVAVAALLVILAAAAIPLMLLLLVAASRGVLLLRGVGARRRGRVRAGRSAGGVLRLAVLGLGGGAVGLAVRPGDWGRGAVVLLRGAAGRRRGVRGLAVGLVLALGGWRVVLVVCWLLLVAGGGAV